MNRKDSKGALRQRVEYYRGNMTYRELAKKAGTSIVELFDILGGKVKNSQPAKVRRLAQVLGVTMRQLGVEHGVQPDQNGTLGQRIEFYRNGIPLEELAIKAGVSAGALHTWMRGMVKNPQPAKVRRLAQALGVTMKQLGLSDKVPPDKTGTLGERMEYYRNDTPLRELAVKAKVSVVSLHNLIRGKVKHPHRSTIWRLAQALGVHVTALID
jgi:transcriptional regulator with XRE-family HTH domain